MTNPTFSLPDVSVVASSYTATAQIEERPRPLVVTIHLRRTTSETNEFLSAKTEMPRKMGRRQRERANHIWQTLMGRLRSHLEASGWTPDPDIGGWQRERPDGGGEPLLVAYRLAAPVSLAVAGNVSAGAIIVDRTSRQAIRPWADTNDQIIDRFPIAEALVAVIGTPNGRRPRRSFLRGSPIDTGRADWLATHLRTCLHAWESILTWMESSNEIHRFYAGEERCQFLVGERTDGAHVCLIWHGPDSCVTDELLETCRRESTSVGFDFEASQHIHVYSVNSAATPADDWIFHPIPYEGGINV